MLLVLIGEVSVKVRSTLFYKKCVAFSKVIENMKLIHECCPQQMVQEKKREYGMEKR